MEIDRHHKLALGEQQKSLIFGITDEDQLDLLVSLARSGEVFTLLAEKPKAKHIGISELVLTGQSLPMLADVIVAGSNEGVASVLKKSGFDQVILAMEVEGQWQDSAIERAATLLAGTVEILTKTGQRHSLTGENAHRLIYNKHYLTCLFKHLPLPENRSVLEVGCGDGLVCEYMVNLGAKQVVGVDVMQTAGCNFPNPRIKYLCRDAQKLPFPDQSFDMVYSIATFEHVADPKSVFDEILRLVKVGGYFYVQAGPLYHSPFGHHMFSYFGEYPWIHLRKSPVQILRYAETTGAAARIKEDMVVSAEDYINSMLSRRHINGRLLDQYGLDALRSREDIREISFAISYEGADLLTPDIIAELSDYDQNWLVQHGFEIVGQRIL
jgi:SAM-dependent methyltransferase